MNLKVEASVLLSVLECVAVNDVRYYLNGICFTSNGFVVGTNGHILCLGKHGNDIAEDIILSIGKLPTRKFSYAVFDLDGGLVRFFSCLDLVVGVCICEVINAKYPNVVKLMDVQDKVKVELPKDLVVNTDYIGKIVKVGKIINPRLPNVIFSLKNDRDAIICKFGDIDHGGVSLMLMPMRGDA